MGIVLRFRVGKYITLESSEPVLVLVIWWWTDLDRLARSVSISCNWYISGGSPWFSRCWTALYRKSMACMVCSPQSNRVSEVALEFTRLSSLLLVSLITGLSVVMMDSLVLNPSYVLIASSFGDLPHPKFQSTTLILFLLFILSIRNKQRQDISWC